jgi:hypothetical protein
VRAEPDENLRLGSPLRDSYAVSPSGSCEPLLAHGRLGATPPLQTTSTYGSSLGFLFISIAKTKTFFLVYIKTKTFIPV